jgi:hypothetical protein
VTGFVNVFIHAKLAERHLKAADAALAAGRLDEALAEASAAKDTDESLAGRAQAIVDAVAAERNYGEVQSAISKSDWKRALGMLTDRTAVLLRPRHPEVDAKRSEVVAKYQGTFVAQAQDAQKAGDLDRALQVLEAARNVKATDEVDELIRGVHYDAGVRAESSGAVDDSLGQFAAAGTFKDAEARVVAIRSKVVDQYLGEVDGDVAAKRFVDAYAAVLQAKDAAGQPRVTGQPKDMEDRTKPAGRVNAAQQKIADAEETTWVPLDDDGRARLVKLIGPVDLFEARPDLARKYTTELARKTFWESDDGKAARKALDTETARAATEAVRPTYVIPLDPSTVSNYDLEKKAFVVTLMSTLEGAFRAGELQQPLGHVALGIDFDNPNKVLQSTLEIDSAKYGDQSKVGQILLLRCDEKLGAEVEQAKARLRFEVVVNFGRGLSRKDAAEGVWWPVADRALVRAVDPKTKRVYLSAGLTRNQLPPYAAEATAREAERALKSAGDAVTRDAKKRASSAADLARQVHGMSDQEQKGWNDKNADRVAVIGTGRFSNEGAMVSMVKGAAATVTTVLGAADDGGELRAVLYFRSAQDKRVTQLPPGQPITFFGTVHYVSGGALTELHVQVTDSKY